MKTLKFVLLLFIISCNTITDEVNLDRGNPIPDGFDFATTQNNVIDVYALDNNEIGISKVPVDIYAVSETGKNLIASGQTDTNGLFQIDAPVGNHIDSITIETSYLGIPQSLSQVAGTNNGFVFGGASSYEVDENASAGGQNGRTSADYSFLGSYDNSGVPFYLEPVDDYISQDLLDLVNNTLPERFPVPTFNPEYIANDITSDTQLRDSAEIWVTFVHEGAGWRNALGYYTYDLSNPPTSVDDITHKVIFPNVSFNGSGGGMESGNKVSLGTFPANTGIGWFLVPQGWSGSGVNNSNQIKYSNKDFNTFTSEAFRIAYCTPKR